ncbi:MAG: nuclear transport factor 2 family protein [Candidatus Marinimicrobia bacterium]|nr:nuclear transport factor 2 family protein [Candidatus Neomarinimicrobiota bacterium]
MGFLVFGYTQTIDESSEVKAALIDMWDAIENEDMERYAGYIHPDFTQFGETDTILREGKEAEVEGIRGWVATSENIHTEMVDPKVTIRGNTAWIVYYWSDSGTTNGNPFATNGKSTRIFVKENGRWLCIHGHYTLIEEN